MNPNRRNGVGPKGGLSRYATVRGVAGLAQEPLVVVSAAAYQPRRPPVWIPSHLAFNCSDCEGELGGTLSAKRVEHCRNCGRCFCQQCCSHFVPIPEYGYFEPTRVCFRCRQGLERQAGETLMHEALVWEPDDE